MFINLHIQGFLQGSTYPRNILIQPGPLTVPPSERSLAVPSFRIIDFGRAEYQRDCFRNAVSNAAWGLYQKWLEDFEDFITEVGQDEAETEYTITIYDDTDEEEGHENKEKVKKCREMTMVMGLEKDKWERLNRARNSWRDMVIEAGRSVEDLLDPYKGLDPFKGATLDPSRIVGQHSGKCCVLDGSMLARCRFM